MNILIYGFSGKILGGIETFILNMNEHMSKDCIFDYIIDGDVCVYEDRIKQRGGSIFFVPGVRKNPLGYIQTFNNILREQKQKGTNVLYYQLFSLANILPVIIAKLNGYKVILHAHNNGLQSKSKIYTFIHNIGKFITRRIDIIRFTNSKLSSTFMFGKDRKSEIIYNAINVKKFCYDHDARSYYRNISQSNDQLVIGFVGRFFPQKNPLFMLQVFSEIVKIHQNSKLWIVGEGDMESEMKETAERLQISDKIKWWGRRNDVEKIMSGMDLLLQPSLFEGLGIVLIEAQSCGLPCVTSADVVPQEAKASDIIYYKSLKEQASDWGKLCYTIAERYRSIGRDGRKVDENFNISFEALRLERLLNKYAR